MFVMRAAVSAKFLNNDGNIDLNQLKRHEDGSAIFNVQAMRTGVYDYMAFELPRDLTSQFDREIEFDTIVQGEIEEREVRKILKDFEALPVTNEHIFIDPNNKDDIAGRVLKNGKLERDGHVSTRLVIESADLLAEIETGRMVEVSIGFHANTPVVNETRQEGEPDFFIRGIELNHLAVVRRGRAGSQARLSHDMPMFVHGFNDNFDEPEAKLMKIKIGNSEFDLPKEAVAAIKSEQEEATTQLTNAKAARDKAVADLATEQQSVATLRGENAALQKQVDDGGNVEEAATALVAQHDSMASMLETLGSKTKLEFGKYDATDELRKALDEFGVKGLEHSDYDSLVATYQGVAATITRKSGQGALEGQHGSPTQIAPSAPGMRRDRGASRVAGIVHNRLFKTNKAEEKA